MLRYSVVLPALSLALGAVAFAQNGDKKGEVQQPLPDHIKVPPAPVRSPEEELATFKLAPGFKAELVAADPLIGDPIAMQFGADGRLWVVEMRGYMPDIDGNKEREPVSLIAVLTDTDGDGRYDKRTVFADGLIMPRALSLVADGLLVAEPPTLWYLRDTDGDGKADAKTQIASDYGNITNPEHNANGLLWAMDNWIYSANYTARFRYQGDGKFARESTVTRGQWGITQDDTGRIYYNSNSDPLRFDALPTAYLKRNPYFNATGANVQLVPATLKIWPSRVTTGVNRGYRTLDNEGKITSMTAASGPAIYRGELFAEEFRGDAFVPEPSANLIKRIKLDEQNGAQKGANAYEGTEFMTSTDERFRPVNVYNGPDGALYVVDLYRGILQHRIYMTSFLRQQVQERGLDKGIAKGRIWRIVPEGAPKANFQLGLAKASAAELVDKLGDTNGWVRDTAQRLLAERRNGTAELKKAVGDNRRPALARLHALWALDGSEALDRATVIAALRDVDARVVAAAIRLSERFIRPAATAAAKADAADASAAQKSSTAGGDPELSARVATLVKTRTEPEVRLQLALTLGEARTAGTDEALRALAIAAGQQPFVADAIVSGLAGREIAFLEALVKNPEAEKNAIDPIRFAMSAVMKSGKAPSIERVLALTAADTTPEWARTALLAGIRHYLPRTPDGRTLVGALAAEPKPLLALAEKKDTASGKDAEKLLAQLKWPGKPGAASAAVRPLTEAEQALYEKGKAQFALVCAACHQPNGQGLAGLAPSLVNSRWVLGDPRLLARIVLNGKTTENLIMPPWKAALNDEVAAGVLTFLRRSWEHDADPVSPRLVEMVRADLTGREEPFTEADLNEVAQMLPRMGRGGGGGGGAGGGNRQP